MKNSTYLLVVAALVMAAFGVYQYSRSRSVHTPDSPKSPQRGLTPSAPAAPPLTLPQLRRYADLVGIDTSRFTARLSDSPQQQKRIRWTLLLEMRYGKKPTGVAYTALRETIDSAWLQRVTVSVSAVQVDTVVALEPYHQLVAHYRQLRRGPVTPGRADTLRQIQQTLNFYRYTNRFGTDPFILVNIPAGELTVFDRWGKRLLPMPVIVGRYDQRTPCMTTYIKDIVAYPNWNVPSSIALDEMLPRMKRDPLYVYEQNLQILDEKGRELDPEEIDWDGLTTTNFPYRIRQVSGDENAMGLLKFNLQNPLAIYLHDTNSRDLFTLTADRWRSHGCVRVHKPVELANWMLGKPHFDTGFMKRHAYGQKSRVLRLPKPVPLFITYNTADVDSTGTLRVYPDVYALHRQ